MYLRHSTVRKDGKTHTYWRLVRSVRRGSKVVQQTVAQLGELDAQGRARARLLARHVTGRAQQSELFEDIPSGEHSVAVRLDRIRLERARRFGDVWLGWTLWRALRFDELLATLMPPGREQVAWSTMAAVLVLARLTEPSSELHIAERWYRTTALEDILGLTPQKVNDDRLYRGLDRLLEHKAALEQHIRARLGELFEVDYDLLLYDVTSNYFEGQALANPQAQRGHSRDHRPDCKQVCIALVVTREGLPLGYEVFAGNRTDVTTVEEIVTTMEARHGRASRVWVMDRGMTSESNLAWLRQENRHYLVGTPRSELKKHKADLVAGEGWQALREGIEVKLCAGPDGAETFLLCRSADRHEKERAMYERFAERIREGLASLGRRLQGSRRRLDAHLIERQIGRLLQRNTRAAGSFEIQVETTDELAAGVRLHWRERPEWRQWAEHTEGCYILRTNVTGWSPEELWRTYIQLTEAEAAFRIQKSELSIRPVWHQRADRVQAHILVCFLAYVLWKTLEQWQTRAGLGRSPGVILGELGRIQSTDVVLPLAEKPQKEIRIRCVVRPDEAQRTLLQHLGLRLPERLRSPMH